MTYVKKSFVRNILILKIRPVFEAKIKHLLFLLFFPEYFLSKTVHGCAYNDSNSAGRYAYGNDQIRSLKFFFLLLRLTP